MRSLVFRRATTAERTLAMLGALTACTVLVASAQAQTSATLMPLLSPDRLGARGAISVRIQFADPIAVVPAPVRRAFLRFPAGLTLEVPHLRSCSPSRLKALGPSGCPVEAAIGRGHALVAAHLGSQVMTEAISLWLFLGPLRNLQPSVEVLGQGYTPFDKRVVLSGSVVADSAPYGEKLVLSVPPVPTLPLEPDASIVTLSLTVGAADRRRGRDQNTVRVPPRCPVGGFPVAGEFVYADGSGGDARAAIPCP
jgi:hypothetical protein